MTQQTRRQFTKKSFPLALGATIMPKLMADAQTNSQAAAGTNTAKPPINAELVHEFVANAHGNLARVKTLLAQEPALLNAAWDWGGGDFETAMGAAGHMGLPDIALFLLSRGARMDVFCAAMLGKIEIVKAVLTAYPELRHSKGPHGIPLALHAQAGLKNGVSGCAELLKWLSSLDG